MSSATATDTFNCTPEQFYSIVSDYEKYPKFLTEVQSCDVLEEDGNRRLVEFHISIIKTFSYKLWMTEEPGKKLTWAFDSGDLFKLSNGSWELEDIEGKTKAIYTIDAKFKVFVPGPIAKAMVNVNLPNMMGSYHKRVAELFG